MLEVVVSRDQGIGIRPVVGKVSEIGNVLYLVDTFDPRDRHVRFPSMMSRDRRNLREGSAVRDRTRVGCCLDCVDNICRDEMLVIVDRTDIGGRRMVEVLHRIVCCRIRRRREDRFFRIVFLGAD